MGSRSLVDRLYARHAAGLPFLPIAGGEPTPGEAPAPAATAAAPAQGQTPATTAAAVTATTTAPATPEPPKLITVSEEAFRRSLENERRLKELEAEQAAKLEEADNARIQALAAKGETEKALGEMRTKLTKQAEDARAEAAALKAEMLSGERERVVSAALAGKPYADEDAAAQVRLLLQDRFEAVRDADGRPAVREKGTGRAVAEVVNEALASKPFARFLRAEHRGGAGASGHDRMPAADPAKPARFDEMLVASLAGQTRTTTPAYGLVARGRPANRN